MKSKHFLYASIIAFVGMILLFNVGSAFADKNRLNTFFIVLGSLFLATSVIWIGYKYMKQGGNPNKG